MNDIVDYVALGGKIRRLRHSLDITQDALAKRLGMSPSFLGHLERGSRKASLDTLVRIANLLQVSPDYLLSESLRPDNQFSTKRLTARQRTSLEEIYRLIEATLVDWDKEGRALPGDFDPALDNLEENAFSEDELPQGDIEEQYEETLANDD